MHGFRNRFKHRLAVSSIIYEIEVGIGYTGPCPIVTKFLPVMPQITLITNLVLVCGADVPFFFGNFFYTIFSPIVYCYTSETTHNFLNPIADSDSPYSILSKTNISTP